MAYPDIDTQAIKDTSTKVLESAGAAIKDPSNWAAFGSFMKEAAIAGGAFFKFFGIADTLNELRKLWTGKKDSQNMAQEKHSFLAKIGLSVLYVGHIAATAIAAAVILGATVVAAPIATLVVSATALVKNIAESVKEYRHTNRVQKQLKSTQEDFKAANMDFERSKVAQAAHEDLLTTDNMIKGLKEQRAKLQEKITPDLSEGAKKPLQAQIEVLSKKIASSEKLLRDKKDYVHTFAPPPVAPPAVEPLFKKALAVVDKENEFKLAKMQRNKKLKNVAFSAGILAFAICLCIPALWPVAGAMTIAAAGVGIAAGISALYDGYQKKQGKKAHKEQRVDKAVKLIVPDQDKPQLGQKKIVANKENLLAKLDGLTTTKPKEKTVSVEVTTEGQKKPPIITQNQVVNAKASEARKAAATPGLTEAISKAAITPKGTRA